MQLQLATWKDVETYLTKSTGIIIPIGSTEQHGPNGLIGTDAICPEVIAKGVGEAAGAMVAPTIAVGMAQHHLGFAGSITAALFLQRFVKQAKAWAHLDIFAWAPEARPGRAFGGTDQGIRAVYGLLKQRYS